WPIGIQRLRISVVSKYRHIVDQLAVLIQAAQREIHGTLEVAVGPHFLGELAAMEVVVDAEEGTRVRRLVWIDQALGAQVVVTRRGGQRQGVGRKIIQVQCSVTLMGFEERNSVVQRRGEI